ESSGELASARQSGAPQPFDPLPSDGRSLHDIGEGSMNMPGDLGTECYGINTYSFTHKLRARDCLELLADAGYRRFEIMLVPGHFWPSLDGSAERREIESLIARKSLEVL